MVTTELDNTPFVECTTPVANPLTTMLPVELLPKVNVCLLVVASIPVPVRYVLLSPLFAEIEAVGVPLFTFIKANLADCV